MVPLVAGPKRPAQAPVSGHARPPAEDTRPPAPAWETSFRVSGRPAEPSAEPGRPEVSLAPGERRARALNDPEARRPATMRPGQFRLRAAQPQ